MSIKVTKKKQVLDFPILAIDYGTKRVGLAVSDFKGKLATPVGVISIKKDSSVKNLIAHLDPYVNQWQIKSFLVGNPSALANKEVSFKKELELLKSALSHHFGLAVLEYDESMSTKNAYELLKDSGQNQKSSKSKIDSLAATVFLQEFLEHWAQVKN